MSSPELSELLNSIQIMRSELSDYWEDSDCTSDGSEDLVGESITYYNSDDESYPPEYPHPDLVAYAKKGDITSMRKLINEAEVNAKEQSDDSFAKFVNDARVRKDVRLFRGFKCVYEDEFDWYDDTALIASARLGNVEIVKLLLLTGVCDPTLKSCPDEHVYENAYEAVTNAKDQNSNLNVTFNGNSKEVVMEMLDIANKYWEPATYQSARGDKRRVFSNRIKCKDEAELDVFIREIRNAASNFKPNIGIDKDLTPHPCKEESNNKNESKTKPKENINLLTTYENLDASALTSLLMERDQELLELKIEIKHKEDINSELINVAVDTEKERLLEKIFDEVKCTICTEVFMEPTSLNCGHIYCKFCLSAWRKQCDNDESMELNCPTCREKIQTEDHNLPMDNLIDAMMREATKRMKEDRSELIKQRKKKDGFKTGILKCWDMERGFGFIIQDDGDSDLFVHFTGIKHYDEDKHSDLLPGQIVNYEIDELFGRPRARNVTAPNGEHLDAFN